MPAGLRPDATTADFLALPGAVQGLRNSRALAWLGVPLAYAVGTSLLSLLSAGTSLLAPTLLGPSAFGAFALLSSLFQYAGKFDLGLSQLADRELTAAKSTDEAQARSAEILRASWAVGLVILSVVVPLAAFAAFFSGRLSAIDTALAVGGGAFAMIANTPVTLYRASSRIWEFTVLALLLQVAMTAPRLGGILYAGVTGCFVVLLVWYGVLAGTLARPAPRPRSGSLAPIFPVLRSALPLFVFNALWLVYMTANRWIAAIFSSPVELGLFAFGANLAFIGLGLLSTIAQVRYPKLLGQAVHAPRGACSHVIEREAHLVALGLTIIAALAIVLVEPVIDRLFPSYGDATSLTVVFAISCIPLGVVAWLIPISMAMSRRPRREGLTIFVPAYLILAGAMFMGDKLAGGTGQAWGCTIAALTLVISLAMLMHVHGLLSRRAMARVIAVQIILVAATSVAAWLFPITHSFAVPSRLKESHEMPPTGWKLAFSEDFSSFRLWNGSGGIWEPHYPWGARTNPPNHELQYYVDPRPGGEAGDFNDLNPFSIEDGSLVIRARPAEGKVKFSYVSGLISTAQSFTMLYGYVEIRAKLPNGKGLWPAFWLAPKDHSWPPELDVMEVLGDRTRTLFISMHTSGSGGSVQSQARISTPDLSAAYHTYAVKWTPEEIVWYFDGRAVGYAPTPSDMHKPMYLIANLAVGGGWPGPPDSSTLFPAEYRIDSVRVFAPPVPSTK
ncbi:family 16 glycosylhydrolase [Microvirga flavescens]|uniref:family 16 glycosylhydrolase n=1 Tax=Microvirga flavescens TaxID=2249811 RepID=UPI000DD92073|nr:family 16 glycosylhydrolase [Microvirga flavescens]